MVLQANPQVAAALDRVGGHPVGEDVTRHHAHGPRHGRIAEEVEGEDAELTEALAVLDEQRPAALQALEQAPPATPLTELDIDLSVVQALITIVSTYQRECWVAP